MMGTRALKVVRQFLFRADAEGVAVPPLDGALTPNDLLDEGVEVVPEGSMSDPAGLDIADDGRMFVVDGNRLLVADLTATAAEPQLVTTLPGNGGAVKVARDGQHVFVCIGGVGVVRVSLSDPNSDHDIVVPLLCPTDVDELPDGRVVVTEGSDRNGPDAWARDLLEKNARGRLIVVDVQGGQTVLASGLAFPSGVCVTAGGGSVLVSEAWTHSLTAYTLQAGGGHAKSMLWDNFPGYPGRLNRDPAGGYWLSVFALRTHLVEFVLLEDDFRHTMMESIEPEYWIRPMLRTLNSGLEPLQGGQLKKLGKTKPWAPARSYGLVVQLDAGGAPIASLHSRAAAETHGVVVAQPFGDRIVFVARGRQAVMSVVKPGGNP